MDNKDLFDKLKEQSQHYCLLVGWVDLHKDPDEEGRFYMQENIEENEYWQKVGGFPHDLIRDAIGNIEWLVDNEGFYEFWCLMSHTRSGGEDYLEVLHMETDFQISFEQREAETKEFNEAVKDTDLFGNKTY